MTQNNQLLIDLAKKVLADSFCFYIKAHYYHWNVEGTDFYQYHELFGEIYKEVHESIDKTAENIRYLQAYSPGSPERLQELSDINPENTIPEDKEMVKRLLEDNQRVLETLSMTFKLSEKLEKFGLSDHIAARIDAHEKHGWMLRSTIKEK